MSKAENKLAEELARQVTDAICVCPTHCEHDPQDMARGECRHLVAQLDGRTPKLFCGHRCSTTAEAEREPELSNAEIAREIISSLKRLFCDEQYQLPPTAWHVLDNKIIAALGAKDTRSRPTVAETGAANQLTEQAMRERLAMKDERDYWRGRYEALKAHSPTVEAAEIRRQAFDDAIAAAKSVSDKHGRNILHARSAGMAEEHELFQQHRRAAADEIIAVLTAARDAAPTDPEKDSDG